MLKSLFSSSQLLSIDLNGVDFKIKHTKRKNMQKIILRVENKNEIKLSSSHLSKSYIKEFIYDKKEWILERNSKISSAFEIGSSFYFLDKEYTIEHHQARFKIDENKVYINPLKAKEQSNSFYKKEAIKYLSKRTLYWKNEMQLEYSDLKFRFAKRRWGSCNSKGVISLNPYMMKLSREMIDYIIVHELSHLEHLNHSKKFYALVETYLPDYVQTQNEIKTRSLEMAI